MELSPYCQYEKLRKEYNVAVANGLIIKARQLDRVIKSIRNNARATAAEDSSGGFREFFGCACVHCKSP
jgi:hypothetical protein